MEIFHSMSILGCASVFTIVILFKSFGALKHKQSGDTKLIQILAHQEELSCRVL